ncbi:MAG TPA: outer membrane protein assembly factor BamA [Methylococcaceae bacterium]|nr:outer membrane protein assembly factor BamA [Methylococcaceae bacterium]
MVLLATGVVARAIGSFTIEDIRIEGLQRVAPGTVFNYLPVKVGDDFDQRLATESIRALFKTGFFKDVRLEQEGDTLVIFIEERPSIASVKITGNKDISSDDLKKALKGIGMTEGKVFDRATLDKVEQEMRRQYFARGKYGVKIDTSVTDLPRNRVDIEITVSEGKVATIKQINVVGNHSYSDEQVTQDFEQNTGNLLSFYTKSDHYSKQKLGADLERLRSFYLDRGYINSQIESTQVAMSPDRKEIYLTVNLKEGDVYKVSDVQVTGKIIIRAEEIIPLVGIGPGDVFSRKLATQTQKAISDRLGDEGYIFCNVNMVPEIDEATKTVRMTFFVDPGKKVYVRRINFSGNTKTRDEVIRREMRQMEAAWASSTKIERSKVRMERLGYFQEVNVETPAVPGTSDQIDVNYKITEKSSGNITAGVGYSQLQGIIFNAAVTQDNVFGTGKKVGFNFNNSRLNTVYSLNYFNPYASVDGISHGFDIAYRKMNAYYTNLANYTTDTGDIGTNLSIPLNEFDRITFNLDLNRTDVKTNAYSPVQILDYIRYYTKDPLKTNYAFDYIPVAVGYVHDTLNRAMFPTEGGAQRIQVMATPPVFGSDSVAFFKASAKTQHFFPLAKDLTLQLAAEAAYGDGFNGAPALPFWENFFAGGPQSMRGFYPSSMGPKTISNLVGQGGLLSLGGSSKIVMQAEILAPPPFMEDSKSIRIGAFIDVGNVYCNAFQVPGPKGYVSKVNNNPSDGLCYAPVKGDFLRYSPGILARWISPFGAIGFSIAQPLNTVYGDRLQTFQFSFGQTF